MLAATTTPGALAAKAATNSIPIVFATDGDPVRLGLVTSLNRPGGNVTGVTQLNVEVGSKRVELAHKLIPAARAIALLVNPANPLTQPVLNDSQAAARALGLQFHILEARNEGDFDEAFKAATDALALHHHLPAIYQFRRFAVAGGLASYGGNFLDSYRQVGIHTGRILKGERPADLPVQQSTKLELILNLKTATTLGIEIPQTLLVAADEVIE